MLLQLISRVIILVMFTCGTNIHAYKDTIQQPISNLNTWNEQDQHIKKYVKARWDNEQFISGSIVEYFLYKKEPADLDSNQKYQWNNEDKLWIDGAIQWLQSTVLENIGIKDNLYNFIKMQFSQGNFTSILSIIETWVQDHISGKLTLTKDQYHALVYICQVIYHKDLTEANKALDLLTMVLAIEFQSQEKRGIDIMRAVLKRLPKDFNSKSKQMYWKVKMASWKMMGPVINPQKSFGLSLTKLEDVLMDRNNHESNGTFKQQLISLLMCSITGLYDYPLVDSKLKQLIATIIDRGYYPGCAKYMKGDNVVTLDEGTTWQTYALRGDGQVCITSNNQVKLEVEVRPVKTVNTPIKTTDSEISLSEFSHTKQTKVVRSRDIPNSHNKDNTEQQKSHDTAGSDRVLKKVGQQEENTQTLKHEITDNPSLSLEELNKVVTSADLAQGVITRKVKYNILNTKLKRNLSLVSKLAKFKILQFLNLIK